jgi:hypothetical protein
MLVQIPHFQWQKKIIDLETGIKMNNRTGNIKRNIETLLLLLAQRLILQEKIKFLEEKNYTNSTKKNRQHLSIDLYQEIRFE